MRAAPTSPLGRFRSSHPERTAVLGGTPWQYWSGGTAQRGLLLLGEACSFGDSSYQLVQQFERRRRVISPSYPALDKMDAVTDGLVRLVDHERIGVCDVYGAGLGAAVAQVLVRQHPDRFDRVALASFGLHSRLSRLLVRVTALAVRLLPYAFFRLRQARAMRGLLLGLSGSRRDEALELLSDALHRATRKLALAKLRLLVDLLDHALKYGVADPVTREGRGMLLYAADDPTFTAVERSALERSWPGAVLHPFLSGGAHLGLTRMGEFGRVLDRFFAER